MTAEILLQWSNDKCGKSVLLQGRYDAELNLKKQVKGGINTFNILEAFLPDQLR